MATLEIDLDATLIVSMVRALNTYCLERADLLSEILYEHGETFAEVAGSVDAMRALESAAKDRNLTDAEDAALHKARSNGGTWMRKKAGQILAMLESPLRDDRAACDASSVEDRPGQDAGEALVGVVCRFSNNGRDWTPFCAAVTISSEMGYAFISQERMTGWQDCSMHYWKHAKPIEVAP